VAQAIEVPDYERVTMFELLQTAEQGRALRGRSGQTLILEDGLASGLLQRRELQGRILVVCGHSRIAVFRA